ncbi:MAG TPA: YutD family protein [Bacillota bacterium]|nr:YutD family protein [Bacillota bacterium]
MVEIKGQAYKIMENKKNAFHQGSFEERYSDILSKYDFIVGDWGYEQLRLKGFYNDRHAKASFDTKISSFEDYLYEYCNFGCAYFVLQKVD